MKIDELPSGETVLESNRALPVPAFGSPQKPIGKNVGRLNTLGSLAWGQATHGRMTRRQSLQMVRNLALVQLREGLDRIRGRLGLLRPIDISIDSLQPPDSGFVADALAHAEQTHEPALLYHSWRTYYFGALIGSHDGLRYDPELFFAAAILHDLGLTSGHANGVETCCFAVSGAAEAVRLLTMKGHSFDRAYQVGEAISLHLNLLVPHKQFGTEAHLVSRGAACDLVGVGHRRISTLSAKQVIDRFPRNGVVEALRFETAEHLGGTRPALMTRLFGRKAPKNPLDEL